MVKYYINYYQIGNGIPGSPCDKVTLERLEKAVISNDIEWVKRFFNSIVNLNLKDYDMSITKWALATKKWDIAKFLLEHNSNVKLEGKVSDPSKDNILFIAANVDAHKNRVSDKKGFDFISRFLKKDKLNIEEGNGFVTPFLQTVIKSYIRTGVELLENGAKVTATHKKTGNSCLHILAEKKDKISLEYLRIILQYIHKRSHENYDKKEYDFALNFLNLKNKLKRTALEMAKSEQNEKAVKLLESSIEQEKHRIEVKKNDDLKKSKNKGSPFHVIDRLPNEILKVIKKEHELRKEEAEIRKKVMKSLKKLQK